MYTKTISPIIVHLLTILSDMSFYWLRDRSHISSYWARDQSHVFLLGQRSVTYLPIGLELSHISSYWLRDQSHAFLLAQRSVTCQTNMYHSQTLLAPTCVFVVIYMPLDVYMNHSQRWWFLLLSKYYIMSQLSYLDVRL